VVLHFGLAVSFLAGGFSSWPSGNHILKPSKYYLMLGLFGLVNLYFGPAEFHFGLVGESRTKNSTDVNFFFTDSRRQQVGLKVI
jgi:hypothetical protein